MPKNDPRRPESDSAARKGDPQPQEPEEPDALAEARARLLEEGVSDPSDRVLHERAGQD